MFFQILGTIGSPSISIAEAFRLYKQMTPEQRANHIDMFSNASFNINNAVISMAGTNNHMGSKARGEHMKYETLNLLKKN